MLSYFLYLQLLGPLGTCWSHHRWHLPGQAHSRRNSKGPTWTSAFHMPKPTPSNSLNSQSLKNWWYLCPYACQHCSNLPVRSLFALCCLHKETTLKAVSCPIFPLLFCFLTNACASLGTFRVCGVAPALGYCK